MTDEQIVEEFKVHVKGLIKASKFKEAIEYCNIKYPSSPFTDLYLREMVTFVHWWTKVFYKAGDLRNMTAKCLTKVNTMINTILTSAPTNFKKADGTTPMAQIEVD